MTQDVWGLVIAGVLLVAAFGVAFVYSRRKAAIVAVEESDPAPMTRADVYEVMATMAFVDLTENEKTQVREFIRNYRAAVGSTVRGLRQQQLLLQSFVTSVAPLWAQIDAGELIDDGSGLAGADLSMTKAEFDPVFTWTVNLLAALYSVTGGAKATVWPTREVVDGYGVQLAGPTNIG